MKICTALLLGLMLSLGVTAQTTWKKASSEKYSVSFEYPANWGVEETQDGLAAEGILLGDDNNKATFGYGLYDMPENFNVEMLDTSAKQMIAYMTVNAGFKQTETLKETTINNHKAITGVFSATSQGSTMQIVLTFVFHKNEFGVLMYGDDESQYKQSYEKYFKHMLSTIVLTD